MINSYLKLSHKLPKHDEQLFCLLDEIFKKLKVDYLVVGAKARDIILEHVYNFHPQRATLDVDLGISIEVWAKYKEVQNTLIKNLDFIPHAKITHRLISDKFGQLDIIPFGEIERENQIIWPPQYSTKMSLLGFNDAFQSAKKIQITEEHIIPVASLAGLAILKLIAWNDREFQQKDATDFIFILKSYLDAGNRDRISNEFSKHITDDFDYEIMSAIILGSDINQITSQKCRTELYKILKNDIEGAQKLLSRLAENLAGSEKPYEKSRKMLTALMTAFKPE